MSAFKWTMMIAALGVSSASFAAQSTGVIVSHYEPLQRLQFTSDASISDQKLTNVGPVTLTFDALGRSFNLKLEPNNGLLSASSLNAISENLKVYRGQITDNPDSWVRIVSFNGVPSGMIWDGEQMFAIEAPGDSLLSEAVPVIFRLADSFITPGALSCGDTPFAGNGAANYKTLMGELTIAKARAAGAVSEINLGAIGDFEFTDSMGSGADAAIIARMNNVDGIFSEQVGVQINVQVLETFPSPGDPFTDTADAAALLNEVATYREITSAQNTQGLTHLYTGRNLDSSTVGIAFGGALCLRRFAAGLSEGNRGTTIDSLITAHEIGHNFGAPHDGLAGSACEAEPQTFLMAPSINGSDQFSACSIAEMQDDIAAAACITPLPSVDMTVSLNGQSPAPLLGNSVTLTFDVSNNGTLQANNVATAVTLPNNVSFVSAAASSGSCSNGAGTVNCALGDVPGITTRTVTITSTTTAVGSAVFNAIVSADVDDDLSNNQFAAQITISPAVDLVVNTPAAATVTIDQSTTVSTVLENRSVLGATGVTLSISLDSGLRADAATWTAGTCSVTAQQVDCQAASIAALSNSTLDLSLTGVTAGAQTYTATLSSNEAEADAANNSASGTITVNAVNSGNSEEEGGAAATGPAFVLLLLWTVALRYKRRVQQFPGLKAC